MNHSLSLPLLLTVASLTAPTTAAPPVIAADPPAPAPPAVTAPAPKLALPAAPAWETLTAPYTYDAKAAILDVKETPTEEGDTLRIHLTFTDTKGEKVTGLFVRPKKEGIYPVVLVLHGRGGDKDQMLRIFGKPLLDKGVACLALDASFHGERKVEGKNPMDIATFLGIIRTTVLDYRQALDYLATRKDVDSKRVGLFGYSMGAMTGAILAGVETRIGEAALCVGGDPIRPALAQAPEALRTFASAASPSLYIGHIAPRPVYMVNGTKDTTITPEAAKIMQEAAQEPKTIVWADSGHILPAEPVQKSLAWLLEKLNVKVAVGHEAARSHPETPARPPQIARE